MYNLKRNLVIVGRANYYLKNTKWVLENKKKLENKCKEKDKKIVYFFSLHIQPWDLMNGIPYDLFLSFYSNNKKKILHGREDF